MDDNVATFCLASEATTIPVFIKACKEYHIPRKVDGDETITYVFTVSITIW